MSKGREREERDQRRNEKLYARSREKRGWAALRERERDRERSDEAHKEIPADTVRQRDGKRC